MSVKISKQEQERAKKEIQKQVDNKAWEVIEKELYKNIKNIKKVK